MKQVEIQYNGNDVTVTVGPVSWGQYKKIRRKSIIVREHNGKSVQFRDMDIFDNLMMLMSIKEAPFEIIEQNVDKLSLADGMKLSEAVIEVNKGVPRT